MEVIEALLSRRSVRRYKRDPVPPDVLEKILEVGRWSPSASNSQPWEFIVFTERELKKKVARAFMYGSFLNEAPTGVAVIVDPYKTSCPPQDGTLAAYSMMLAAHGLGLGTCWINPSGNDAPIYELLGIPEGKELICVLSLGYPAESPKSTRRRLQDIVHTEQYGNRVKRQSEE